MANVMHSIGQLTGAVQAMHQGMTARIEDIRTDIRRMEASTSERMDRIEDSMAKRIDGLETNVNARIDNIETSVGKRVDSLGTRVSNLEAEDKRLIEKTAKLSTLSGTVAGALTAVAIELAKRMH